MTEPLSVIARARDASALLHPMRARVLAALAEPGSAASVARALRLSRQKVNYHLRALEEAGFVEHVEDRRRGNCTERIVRAKARRFVLSPTVLGALASEPDAVQDRLSSAYAMALAARTVEELAELRARAAAAGKKLATLTVQTEFGFNSAAEQHAFAEELAQRLSELALKYSRGRRRFKLTAQVHPALPGRRSNEHEDS